MDFRYKTKLCNKECCPYQKKCLFAHSDKELRTSAQNAAQYNCDMLFEKGQKLNKALDRHISCMLVSRVNNVPQLMVAYMMLVQTHTEHNVIQLVNRRPTPMLM